MSWRQLQNIIICTNLDETELNCFTPSYPYRELDNIDGEPVVLEWKHFLSAHFPEAPPGIPKHEWERTHPDRRFQGPNHLHVDVQRHRSEPRDNEKSCKRRSSAVAEDARKFSKWTLVTLWTWI